jgi:ABC-2 type transport system permease protein
MIIVAVFSPMFYDLFSRLAVPLSRFGYDSTSMLYELFLAPLFFTSAFLFAFQFAPLLVTELFENDMIPFLLTMPIRRSSLFLVSAIDTFLMSGFGFAITLVFSICYALLRNTHPLFGILSIIVWVLFLTASGLLAGFLLARFIGKTAAKRTAQFISFFVLILILLFPQVIAPLTDKDPAVLFASLKKSMDFFLFRGWPHVWFMEGVGGNPGYLLLLFALSVVLVILVIYFSNRINLTPARNKAEQRTAYRKKQRYFRNRGFYASFFTKEFKLMLRESGILWYYIYPLIFPVVMIFGRINDTAFVSLLFMLVASIYSGMASILMMVAEKKIWPFPVILPIRLRTLISLKIITPVFLFTIEYLFLQLILSFFAKVQMFNYFMVLPITIILYYSSLLGMRLFLQDPNRDVSQRNRLLKGQEVLMLEGITMALSMGFFLSFYAFHIFLSEGAFWFFRSLPIQSLYCLFPGIIGILLYLLFRFIRSERRKIWKLLATDSPEKI